MRHKIFIYAFIISCGLLFMTCKKYPENTVWFKNPTDIPVINGHITAYVVNGIDSLDLLNSYYSPVQPTWPSPYSKTDRDIKTETFTSCCPEYAHWQVACDLAQDAFRYAWNKDKKSITISGSVTRGYYNKEPFISTHGDIRMGKNQKLKQCIMMLSMKLPLKIKERLK
jgi:hypothetical protein